ncbi:hypothetical protein [Streptomyces sp. NPDC048111]|uniref:hypothetical protein n=1 Tax=Streptomyces sp. NPDC048111 TaxID=3365500 RepID=UPI003713A87D
MSRLIRVRAGSVLGAAVLLLTGCSSGADGGGTLSVARIKERAKAMGSGGAAKCPVAYDIAAAGKAAGYGDRAGASPERPAATAEFDGSPDSPIRQSDGALIDCVYRVGAQPLHVYTVGTGKGSALSLMAPLIQRDAKMSTAELMPWIDKAMKSERSVPVTTPGQTVATVRLPVDGAGDAVLVASLGPTGSADAQLGRLARNLAEQARS